MYVMFCVLEIVSDDQMGKCSLFINCNNVRLLSDLQPGRRHRRRRQIPSGESFSCPSAPQPLPPLCLHIICVRTGSPELLTLIFSLDLAICQQYRSAWLKEQRAQSGGRQGGRKVLSVGGCGHHNTNIANPQHVPQYVYKQASPKLLPLLPYPATVQ